jgi:hypothetical protein
MKTAATQPRRGLTADILTSLSADRVPRTASSGDAATWPKWQHNFWKSTQQLVMPVFCVARLIAVMIVLLLHVFTPHLASAGLLYALEAVEWRMMSIATGIRQRKEGDG